MIVLGHDKANSELDLLIICFSPVIIEQYFKLFGGAKTMSTAGKNSWSCAQFILLSEYSYSAVCTAEQM